MSEQLVNHIQDRCVEIIYKYPNIFVISNIIQEYSKFIVFEYKESFIKYVILKQIGLEFVVKKIVNQYWSITHTFDTCILSEQQQLVKKSIIFMVLNEYIGSDIFSGPMRKEYDEMLKTENL